MENYTKVIGYYPIVGLSSIDVYGFEYGIIDKVIYRYNFSSAEVENKRIYKAQLYTNNKGVYFRTKVGRVYLHDVIRINCN